MASGEILLLSYIPNVTASDTLCPICNMREQENDVHFIGRLDIWGRSGQSGVVHYAVLTMGKRRSTDG